MKHLTPAQREAHGMLVKLISGAVRDAFMMHPEYLTPAGRARAKDSIIKRVSGAVMGYSVQAEIGSRPSPAAKRR